MSALSWLFLDSGPCQPAWNMAFDEALLEAMPRLQQPALRFYGWIQPAATFGYFQKHREVEQATPLRPLIRRPTGGGIVPHDADWTYCLCFPTTHEWYSVAAIESYRRVHAWLQAAFQQIGVQTQLAPEPRKTLPGQCFVGWEQFDLLWRGVKIAGAAQRRRKDGLLIQGSVQPQQLGANRAACQQAMVAMAPFGPHSKAVQFAPDETLLRRADELAAARYSLASYNQRR